MKSLDFKVKVKEFQWDVFISNLLWTSLLTMTFIFSCVMIKTMIEIITVVK